MPVGPSQDLRRLVLAVERQPGRNGADFRRLQGHVDDPVGGLHLEHIARLELVRRDVHRPAVDLEVPVRDELARLLARRAQAEPVDDVVHAQLEVAEQVQAGDARFARRLVEIVAELLLEQPVDPPRLLLGAQLQAVVGRLALAGLAVHAGRERAALDGALGRVAALALQVQLGALAAAKAADRARVVGHFLHAPPLRRPAPVVRDGRDVGDGADLEACGLQRADCGLAAGARPAHEHLDRAHAVLQRPLGGRLGGLLRGKWRRLAAALEALRSGRAPGDDVAVDVGDGDDRVVERALDVSLPLDHVLALAAARANDLLLGHYLPAFTFFLPATARLGPRRLRALVRVRWPRTGRPRRCRMPRYEPISVRRLMLLATSRRRSPSMRSSLAPAILSMIWRRRVTSSSERSLTRVSGLTPAVFTSF